MAEKIAKLNVKRESGFLYFLRGPDVWKTPMKRGGGPAQTESQAEKVAAGDFTREPGFLYFLDADGDVARAKRQVGGKVRAKTKK